MKNWTWHKCDYIATDATGKVVAMISTPKSVFTPSDHLKLLETKYGRVETNEKIDEKSLKKIEYLKNTKNI